MSEGSSDDAANKLGVEWREQDPSPPYQSISAPALAFWHPKRADADVFRKACSRLDWIESDLAEILIKRFEKISEPLFNLMDHDMELFSNQLSDSEIVEIPGANYHTFVSHPQFVEKEMHRFLSKHNSSNQ